MSSLIQIKIGEKVLYEDGRIGKLVDMRLVPNGSTKTELVVILFVEMDGPNGKTVMSATSNRFKPAPEETYDEFYPSVHVIRMSDEICIKEYKKGYR
jgi:hypothetical protein